MLWSDEVSSDSPKEGDHGSDKGDDGHVDRRDNGSHKNVVERPDALMLPKHVVVGKSKGRPAVDLVAADDLQHGKNVERCYHARRSSEGEHHE